MRLSALAILASLAGSAQTTQPALEPQVYVLVSDGVFTRTDALNLVAMCDAVDGARMVSRAVVMTDEQGEITRLSVQIPKAYFDLSLSQPCRETAMAVVRLMDTRPGIPDFDKDGDVDGDDFAVFQVCVSGPAVPYDPDCLDAALRGPG